MDEKLPLNTTKTYRKTKYMAEKIIMDKENAISLRFATVFGLSPKMRIDLMLNNFVYTAMKEKTLLLYQKDAQRSFIHIDDAVNRYYFSLENFKVKGNIYNAGGNELNYLKQQIANMIKDQINYEIFHSEMKDVDQRNYSVCYDKIESVGFRPKQNIKEGISELKKSFSIYTL